MIHGPVIVIEDNSNEKELFETALKEIALPNILVWFKTAVDAWSYLKRTIDQPFIIFCNVNLPQLNGLEFKRQIDEDPELRKKSIPFIFYSTLADSYIIDAAYTQLTVQGFFEKKSDYMEMKRDIKLILDYWQACKHPDVD